jgi:hypothetical protein
VATEPIQTPPAQPTEPTQAPPAQPAVAEPAQSPPAQSPTTESQPSAPASPQPETGSAQPTTAESQSRPLIMLSQNAECIKKCEDVCPQSGACLTACNVHFCGLVQESQPWPLMLLIGGAMVLLGGWAALRLRWRKLVPGSERRPLLAEPLDL